MSIENDKNPVKLLVELDAPGVGNKNSSISVKKYEGSLDKEALAKAVHEIVRSSECVVVCNHTDDGCIDGRCVIQLALPDSEGFNIKKVDDNTGNERAKVAGGGLITSLAMYKALGEGVVSPEQDIIYIADEFAKKDIYCGGHTGIHGSEEQNKTDCGANDRFDEIIDTAIKNREQIAKVTELLVEPTGEGFSSDSLDSSFDSWSDILTKSKYFDGSNGSQRLEAIKNGILIAQENMPIDKKASVLKNLGGDHNEILLVVNYAKGRTFSQTKLRETLIEQFPGVDPNDLPQVFALDVWRIEELAHAVADLPEKATSRQRSDENRQERFSRALHAGIAYQVATYATLTDGSLPVYVFAEASI